MLWTVNTGRRWWGALVTATLLLLFSTKTAVACLDEHYFDPISVQIICPQHPLTLTGKNSVPEVTRLRSEDMNAIGCPSEAPQLQQIRSEYERWIGDRRRDSTFLGSVAIFHSQIPGNLTFTPWSNSATERTSSIDYCLHLVDRHVGDWLVTSVQLVSYCTEDPVLADSVRYTSCGEISTSMSRLPGQLVRAFFTDYQALSSSDRTAGFTFLALMGMIAISLWVAWCYRVIRHILRPTLARAILTLLIAMLWLPGALFPAYMFGINPSDPFDRASIAVHADPFAYVFALPIIYPLVCLVSYPISRVVRFILND